MFSFRLNYLVLFSSSTFFYLIEISFYNFDVVIFFLTLVYNYVLLIPEEKFVVTMFVANSHLHKKSESQVHDRVLVILADQLHTLEQAFNKDNCHVSHWIITLLFPLVLAVGAKRSECVSILPLLSMLPQFCDSVFHPCLVPCIQSGWFPRLLFSHV